MIKRIHPNPVLASAQPCTASVPACEFGRRLAARSRSTLIKSTVLVFTIAFNTRAAPTAQLNDAQLSHIQFDQKLGASISPDLPLTDETGKPVRLGDYFGAKPSVLVLGYYGCPMLCTLVLNGAADCFRNMNWKPGQQFNVVFVSIDPAEKPPLAAAKKQSYMQSYSGAFPGNWHFLTGDQTSISSLANTIGYRYAYDTTAKQFAHPSGIVIVSTDGKVARYFFGVNFAASGVDSALRDAAANKSGPAEPEFTLLCFHYAPVHGKYGALVMALVRGGAFAAVGLLGGLLLVSGRRNMRKTQ